MVLSPETFPGYLNYVYYTTLKKEEVKGSTETSLLKKKNLWRDNTQLKSPATSMSLTQRNTRRLWPLTQKISFTNIQLLFQRWLCMHCTKCALEAYLNIFVLERLPITIRVGEDELFFMNNLWHKRIFFIIFLPLCSLIDLL